MSKSVNSTLLKAYRRHFENGDMTLDNIPEEYREHLDPVVEVEERYLPDINDLNNLNTVEGQDGAYDAPESIEEYNQEEDIL